MFPLKANEIFGNWATLLLPVNKDNSINYSKLEDEIDILISMQVNGIYSNGTAGEFYNQTENEFDEIHSILAEKCNVANMPFQIGCSHSNPKVSLERVKRAKELCPSAIQIILPDWSPPSIVEIIDFLEVMTNMASPIGLVLYNPPHAKRKLTPEDFYQIKEASIELAGCKVGNGNKQWYDKMKALAPDLSLFIPGHHLATGIRFGADGAYSNVACLHPGAAQKWYELMLEDMSSALETENRIQGFMNEHIVHYLERDKYSNQAVDKFLAAVGGWSDIGTRLRWPYKGIPIQEVESVRKICKKILPEFFSTIGN